MNTNVNTNMSKNSQQPNSPKATDTQSLDQLEVTNGSATCFGLRSRSAIKCFVNGQREFASARRTRDLFKHVVVDQLNRIVAVGTADM